MSNQGIYFIKCTVSSKCYVGSSVDITRRLRSHLRALSRGKHGSPLLQRAWDKHGADTFVTGVHELVERREDLLSREQFWIDSSPSEFNISREAGRVTGFRHTPEERQRQSTRAVQMWSKNGDALRSSIKRGWENPQSRAAISESSRRYWSDPNARSVASEKNKRRLQDPVAREAMSQRRREDWADPVKRARLLEGRRRARLLREQGE